MNQQRIEPSKHIDPEDSIMGGGNEFQKEGTIYGGRCEYIRHETKFRTFRCQKFPGWGPSRDYCEGHAKVVIQIIKDCPGTQFDPWKYRGDEQE